MIIFPAIDLKDGVCVRLLRGDIKSATVFNTDPGEQARAFEAAGFEWLHVVDLNGAFAGTPVNGAAVEQILQHTSLPIQLGGGIRDLATVEYWLGRGVSRVILGTIALHNPTLVKEACSLFPGKIAVGIDARGAKVTVEGWAQQSELSALEVALRFEDCGVSAIIYTDVERDGMLGGVNVSATAALAKALTTPVIASGGVSNLEDIAALKPFESKGICGVICGRALYDGRIEPRAALNLAKSPLSALSNPL
jgi:phosphoribosylformimino-5-aminoimidazole carboxamide ribotide isomerase